MLRLRRIRGETPSEEVFLRTFRNYDLFLKRELPTSPRWEWIIMEGAEPVSFGDEPTFEAAEAKLASEGFAEVPGFELEVADEVDDFYAGGFDPASASKGDDGAAAHTDPLNAALRAEVRRQLVSRARVLLRLLCLALVTGARERLALLEQHLIGLGSPLAGMVVPLSAPKVDTGRSTSDGEVRSSVDSAPAPPSPVGDFPGSKE